ncbi:MAG: hypothetical protein IJ770_03255 [Alphaproteobacteria bacterium]|nr:hypothetical protein [Alphaproteobacteria bacterium]
MENRDMNEAMKMLEVMDVVTHYDQYRAAGAVEKIPTLNYPDIRKTNEDINLRGAPIQKLDAILEGVLKQPIMADIYATKGIKPEDVSAYIEEVKQQPISHKKAMLQAFVGAYGTAALNMEGEKDPVVNGKREMYALRVKLNDIKSLMWSMERFVEAHQPVAVELSLWQKIQRKLGFDKEIGNGYGDNVQPTVGATRIIEMTAKKDAEKIKHPNPTKGVKHFEQKYNKSEEYGGR